MSPWFTVTRARSERGAAAVEAGLVTTFLLPLMLGVFVWGNWFWQAQFAPPAAVRLPQGSVVGYHLTCDQVVSLVKHAVVDQTTALGAAYAGGVGLDQVAVRVVEVLPDLSAVVRVSVSVPVDGPFASWLPNDGEIVTASTMRLQNVTVSTSVCS